MSSSAGTRERRFPSLEPWSRGLLLVVVLGACGRARNEVTAATNEAIVDGLPDAGDTAVVALLRGGEAGCSGVLIAPRVVLTAAHCLDEGPPDSVYFGSNPASDPGSSIAVTDSHLDPSYDPVTPAHDVALLLLAQPVAAVSPVSVEATALGDAVLLDSVVRIVGFGLPSSARSESTSTVVSVSASSFQVEASPGLPCFGDSGGPAFDSAGKVVGVVSQGNVSCTDEVAYARVDGEYAAFIEPYLAETVAGSVPVGERCFDSASCASGECFGPSDAPSVRYCTAPCRSSEDCPPGTSCAADDAGTARCELPPPSPGALGTPCETSNDCDQGDCVPLSGDETTRVCSQPCDPNASAACPVGFRCAGTDDAGTSSCIRDAPRPAPGASCTLGFAGESSFRASPLVLFTLAASCLTRSARRSMRRRFCDRGSTSSRATDGHVVGWHRSALSRSRKERRARRSSTGTKDARRVPA